MTAGYYTANSILDSLTVLLLTVTLVYSAFIKKERDYPDRFLWATVLTNLFAALSDLAFTLLSQYLLELDIQITITLRLVFYILMFFSCFFFTMYLSCNAGYELRTKNRWFIWMIPLIVDSLAMIFLISTDDLLPLDLSMILIIVVRCIPYVYLIAAFMMLWKMDRTLVVLPAMLLIIMIYFNIALYNVTIQPFIMALCIFYVYLSLKKRMILIHLGGIILTLCVLTTLVIGNMITSSAFVSYLKTIHDRNDSHLSDVIAVMEGYKAFPWLMKYWMENPDIIKADSGRETDSINGSTFGKRLTDVTGEEAENFPPDKQLLFAELCYYRIADVFETEYTMHHLDDLFLIVPEDDYNAFIIFDAEKNEDGSYRLGDNRDINEERLEWINYETVITDNTTWTWGQYSNSDDFGFYRKIPFGENGEEAYLCNSFNRSEIYAHLAFISSSRTRAIRYLILSAAIILLSLYFMLLKPLTQISRTAKKYQMDKDAEAVTCEMNNIHLKNEIGTFANEFSSLAREMDRYTMQVAVLARDRERVNTELRMASAIQLSAIPCVFPAFPGRKDFDIYADMKPAKEIGGDFYDFSLIEENRLAFLIADVSDKGVPASLFMMSAKNLINYRASEGGTPGEILTSVNMHLCQNNDSMMFVTVWLGILDLTTGILTSASAGHEPPAVKTGDGTFSLFPDDGHGIAMGVMQSAEYTDFSMQLSPGDVIFIYTDGVTEARNDSDEMYGPERMLDCLNKTKDDTPEGIIRNISKDVEAFVKDADQSDDITMLTVIYKGLD